VDVTETPKESRKKVPQNSGKAKERKRIEGVNQQIPEIQNRHEEPVDAAQTARGRQLKSETENRITCHRKGRLGVGRDQWRSN